MTPGLLLGLSRGAESAPPGMIQDLQVLQEAARTSLEEVREVACRLRPGVLVDLVVRRRQRELEFSLREWRRVGDA